MAFGFSLHPTKRKIANTTVVIHFMYDVFLVV